MVLHFSKLQLCPFGHVPCTCSLGIVLGCVSVHIQKQRIPFSAISSLEFHPHCLAPWASFPGSSAQSNGVLSECQPSPLSHSVHNRDPFQSKWAREDRGKNNMNFPPFSSSSLQVFFPSGFQVFVLHCQSCWDWHQGRARRARRYFKNFTRYSLAYKDPFSCSSGQDDGFISEVLLSMSTM